MPSDIQEHEDVPSINQPQVRHKVSQKNESKNEDENENEDEDPKGKDKSEEYEYEYDTEDQNDEPGTKTGYQKQEVVRNPGSTGKAESADNHNIHESDYKPPKSQHHRPQNQRPQNQIPQNQNQKPTHGVQNIIDVGENGKKKPEARNGQPNQGHAGSQYIFC